MASSLGRLSTTLASAKGQTRHFDPLPATSGLPPETDIVRDGRNVSNAPYATGAPQQQYC